jgi:hypothetical protein
VDAGLARQPLQPEAIGAVIEATVRLNTSPIFAIIGHLW